MTTVQYAVGIDIGGTKIAIGVVDQDGSIIIQDSIPTPSDPEDAVRRIDQIVKTMLTKAHVTTDQLTGFGIGAPGPLDREEGVLKKAPNLPQWENYPIKKQIEQLYSKPVYFENDASAAAVAEKWLGAAQHSDHFVYITISTGIGGGLFLNGKLHTGISGNAGDIGHFVIDPNGAACKCGQLGCWEALASGTAIAQAGSQLTGRELTTKEVFEMYKAEHHVITPYIEQVFRYIGIGCVTVINTLDIDLIVIGGGVSGAGQELFDAANKYIRQFAFSPKGRDVQVVQTGLQQNTGLLGAASLVLLDT